MTEFLNGVKLLGGVLPAALEHVPHLEGITSDGLWHTIDGAELSGQVTLLAIDLHHEQGLVRLFHLHLVSLEEILSHTHLFAL